MSEIERMSGTHDCGGDAAAYVLGALGPAEADSFREHLRVCAVCRDEVEALEGVVQALPMSAPQRPVPVVLRKRLMAEVRRSARAPARTRRPWPLPWPRARGRWPRPLAAGLATALIAAAAVSTGFELGGAGSGRLIQGRLAGVSGSAQLRLFGDHGELIVRDLTPPGRGRVYEVWVQSGRERPLPASVLFGVSAGGNADVGLPDSLHGVSAVLVTSEPLGGTQTPTQAPVIVAKLT